MGIDEKVIAEAAKTAAMRREIYGVEANEAAKAMDTQQPDRSLRHLGNVLYMLANLHPDDQCAAYDEALAYYNATCPKWQVVPEEGFVTRLINTNSADGP